MKQVFFFLRTKRRTLRINRRTQTRIVVTKGTEGDARDTRTVSGARHFRKKFPVADKTTRRSRPGES